MFEPGGHHGTLALHVGNITEAAGVHIVLRDNEGGVCPVALVEDHDDEDCAAHHADTTGRLSNNKDNICQ